MVLPLGTPVLPDVYRIMAISWSIGLLDKVVAVSKFALLQCADSFLNLPNDIESVPPKASEPATARGRDAFCYYSLEVVTMKR